MLACVSGRKPVVLGIMEKRQLRCRNVLWIFMNPRSQSHCVFICCHHQFTVTGKIPHKQTSWLLWPLLRTFHCNDPMIFPLESHLWENVQFLPFSWQGSSKDRNNDWAEQRYQCVCLCWNLIKSAALRHCKQGIILYCCLLKWLLILVFFGGGVGLFSLSFHCHWEWDGALPPAREKTWRFAGKKLIH